jgi:hypothetical protein
MDEAAEKTKNDTAAKAAREAVLTSYINPQKSKSGFADPSLMFG